LPDIAIVGTIAPAGANGEVTVLKNDLSGGFGATYASFAVGNTPDAIAAGDFDSDHNLDIVVANKSANEVTVYRNLTNGTFATPLVFVVGTAPWDVVVADFNGDGKPDIAVSNNQSSSVSVLINNTATSGISFEASVPYGTGSAPQGLATGDVNGDTIPDLVVANRVDNSVSVLLNAGDGTGTFGTQTTYGAASTPTAFALSAPYAVALGAFGGGSQMDIAVANSSTPDITAIYNAGITAPGTFSGSQTYANGGSPWSVATGDFNADGLADVVVTNNAANTINVYLSQCQ
jgi:hypothetical protein